MSLRESILGRNDLKSEIVLVPEWGENGTPLELFVRTLTGTERDQIEQAALEERGDNKAGRVRNIRARIVAYSTVDDKGNRVFGDDDIEALGQKSAKALDRLFDVAQRLSGFSKDDVEELAKNSAGAAGDSTSG